MNIPHPAAPLTAALNRVFARNAVVPAVAELRAAGVAAYLSSGRPLYAQDRGRIPTLELSNLGAYSLTQAQVSLVAKHGRALEALATAAAETGFVKACESLAFDVRVEIGEGNTVVLIPIDRRQSTQAHGFVTSLVAQAPYTVKL